MSTVKSLDNYPDISFTDNLTVEELQDHYIKCMEKKYEEITGKKLVMGDADPMRMIAYADCLLLYQVVQYAERAGKMSLLKYSYGDYLENIGAMKGIKRLEGEAAKTRLYFELSAERNYVTVIPAGTRVTASDGVYFYTLETLEIKAGFLDGEVNAECREIGTKGNGYKPGELQTLVDPIPYVKSVRNITETEGGADREADDNLAERIFLAPSSYSVAGPYDAYKYWVKTFDPGITDVFVDSPVPGVVDIRFITENGKVPEEAMLQEVGKYLNDNNIRPLTDHVLVQAPDVVEYVIDLTYYVNESDRTQSVVIQEKVLEAVEDYKKWQCGKVGRDINPNKLCNLIITAGAKRVEIRSPVYTQLPQSSIPLFADAKILYGGIEDD